jgi:shikimate kinase
VWNCTVGEKLVSVGDEVFVEEEGNALLQVRKTNTVISLTGSNPLHHQSMEHIAKSGI